MSGTAVETVMAWHRALNDGDLGKLVGLSGEDVEMGGPRGSAHGADVLRDWAARAGIRLEPRRCFARADTVVVEQAARWPSAEDHRVTEPAMVASVFLVGDGRVASVVRYPDLATALAATGFDESDAVASDSSD